MGIEAEVEAHGLERKIPGARSCLPRWRHPEDELFKCQQLVVMRHVEAFILNSTTHGASLFHTTSKLLCLSLQDESSERGRSP